MRPLRYSINVTLDGCCDHCAIPADEELHRLFFGEMRWLSCGNADASTTMRYYIHIVDSEQRDAAEKVARILCPDVAKSERKSVCVN